MADETSSAAILLLLLLLQMVAYSVSAPLSTSSRWIIDQNSGNRVKLRCVNWVSHLQPMLAEGIDKKPVSTIAQKIGRTGFNCVRFTWPTFMFTRPDYGTLTVAQSLDRFNLTSAIIGIGKNNPQFLTMKVIEVHKAVVDELGKNNLMVVLDNHVSLPNWCCGPDDSNGFFGDSNFNPDEWIQGLTAVARAYKGSPAVVGMSLRNELRGKNQNEADWYKYMQQGAEAVHKENPDFLVIVSGLSFDTNLRFLKDTPFRANVDNKLVFEAHWYAFGSAADQWVTRANYMCGNAIQNVQNNFLFLTTGNSPFPLFLSEFGIDQRGSNQADNGYITCLLATAAEADIDWALWAFQGSYILREGQANLEEFYGVMDINWARPRNRSFLRRLQILGQVNQVPKSSKGTTYLMYHPQSGKCTQLRRGKIALRSCRTGSRWEQHDDGGPIKFAGGGRARCLSVAGEGQPARVSNDCTSNGSKWKFASASGLHLAGADGGGKFLCLEINGNDSMLVTRKCLCLGDDLGDVPKCDVDPQVQWFKFVPTNV
ncbi:glycosyl hydrolase 5 family protein-like [Andrographis paniculata]|uniref:glycosyl hydrolase 5 family protein-like n=1 Tax=Andrographis paniculata TaxID=175694 RepID=UPI0021E77A0A|nr:glycosyl hydrolase 5 family protein-like [Andrographis paniculata]